MALTYRSPTQVECADLFEAVLAQLGSQAEEAEAYLGMTRDQFAEIYRTTGEIRIVLDDGCAVGALWIEERDRQLHIHAIILRPEARGRGIGTRIIQSLKNEFSPRVDEIELGVQDSNADAIRFYERVGFREVPVGTMPGFTILRLALRTPGAGTAS
ncbi:MAG: GNAT family N-acetyltransferase [Candidatus Bipolaricaulis sp.]|nr:GNAT family N-acetyltransferase [Candidatus Bipolaricaulis sp.]MDD5220047.1 GNAT family N-acetyltransferase [Candidatus Bipolaricaulis sp.]